MNTRLRASAYWAAAPLLMLALYWPGLVSWFQKDDFAWLGLRGLVHSPRDLLWALFAPLAEGTIRTLSERVVYLSFTSLFGLHALPFRCLGFATCATAIVMLNVVATKLTGSRAVGFWASILWTLNPAIAIPLAWSAMYDQLLWPMWLLLTFWLLLRYIETGERRFFIAQCVTFVLGFFVLEVNVVYPAIATAYVITSAQAAKRGLLKKIAPLFAISLIYTLIHMFFAPLPASGPYQLHLDLRILQTLTTYWGWALGPGEGRWIGIQSSLIRSRLVWVLTAGLFAFLFRHDRRTPRDRQMIATFFPAWFLIALAPLLPLRDHITAAYLTAPTLGLAMWAGCAIVSGWRAGWLWRIVAASLALIYAAISIPIGQEQVRSFHDRSQRIRRFVLGVAEDARAQPGKIVLLEGVNAELFYDVVYNHAFRLYGINDLYVVPEDRSAIPANPYFPGTNMFFADRVMASKALRKNLAVVFDVANGTPRDATAEYAGSLKAGEIAARVETGNDLFADQLGDGWYPNDGGYRWMGKRALVTLAGPSHSTQRLYVAGYAPAAALKSGPVTMQITIDRVALPPVRVGKPDASFEFDFEVPARFVGAPKIELAVEVDRTFTAPLDPRVFGLVFVSFEVR